MEDRYERLRIIPSWDVARVRGARAVVAGAGALGNEVVKNLLLVGWGELTVVDLDVVESTNLTRSALFTVADVGRPKCEVLAERAIQLGADTKVTALVGDRRQRLSAGTVAASDVLFGCVDNIAARLALAQLAGQAGTLFVDGGLTTWEGTVQTYFSGWDGPCYSCGLTVEDLSEITLRHSCLAFQERIREAGGVATTPITASVTGALMAQQALKWIHQGLHDQPLQIGREIRIDVAYSRSWVTDLPSEQDCPVHWRPVAPTRSPGASWHRPWRDVLQACREALDADELSLHLPIRVLAGWNCLACGAEQGGGDANAHAGDGQVPCPVCGVDVVPHFVTEIDGTEPWLERTPREMGFAALTWVSTVVGDRTTVIELEGTEGPGAPGGDDDDGDAAQGTSVG